MFYAVPTLLFFMIILLGLTTKRMLALLTSTLFFFWGVSPVAGATRKNQTQKTTPKLKERMFVKIIKEVARDSNLTFESYSKDWLIVLKDPTSQKTQKIVGYRFPINSCVADHICIDKPLLSITLENNKIPCVPHLLFLNPSMEGWVSDQGTFRRLFDYAKKCHYQLVLKPHMGTGGANVFHCTTPRELEVGATALYQKHYALAACPFLEVAEEFRLVMLNGECYLCYRKNRPSVVADGKSSIRQLLIKRLTSQLNKLDNLSKLSKFLSLDQLPARFKFDDVPPKGSIIPIMWQHNLGLGATPSEDINKKEKKILLAIAKKTVEAVGINFASVDIIKSTSNEYKVLEVNSGVMMERMPVLLPNGYQKAKKIYRRAIQLMFNKK